MRKLLSFLNRNYLFLTGILGSVLVALWTLGRFFNEHSIFDLVGQQVIARIALDGGVIDATVGATHYIAKIFLLYIPFEALHLEPRLSLVAMTIFVNITAYVLILFALRSIMKQLGGFNKYGFVIGMLWLAAMAGSVFWIQFTNSRNLEVAAGLWLIAIGLKFITKPTVVSGIVWLGLVTVTFFMDPLQVYMSAVPLVIYVVISRWRREGWRVTLQKVGMCLGVLVPGLLLSIGLLKGIESWTGLVVIDSQSFASNLGVMLVHFKEAILGLVQSNIRMLGGYSEDGGRIKQVASLVVLTVAIFFWLFYAFRGRIKREVVIYVVVYVVCIQFVYLASGQTLNGDTSRYLIMLAPVVVIILATVPRFDLRKYIYAGMAGVIIWSLTWVSFSILKSDHFKADAGLNTVAAYVQETKDKSDTTRFYSSMDIALPAMYYHRELTILPLGCEDGKLFRANTFYPQTEFKAHQDKVVARIGIILSADKTITNYPHVCMETDIIKQIGRPESVEQVPTGEKVMYFKPYLF